MSSGTSGPREHLSFLFPFPIGAHSPYVACRPAELLFGRGAVAVGKQCSEQCDFHLHISHIRCSPLIFYALLNLSIKIGIACSESFSDIS